MKVTLDLTRLLHEGAITQAEHDRLARLGRSATGTLLVSLLLGFGVVAVVAGILLMVPNAVVSTGLGVSLMISGLTLLLRGARWSLLANICILVAALLLAAGIVLLGSDSDPPLPFYASCLFSAVVFVLCAVLTRSGLLISLAVLALFAALGGGASYHQALYELQVGQPLCTVITFSLLALAAHVASRFVTRTWSGLLIITARTSLLLVNLGFWVGSLQGDSLNWLLQGGQGIPGVFFALVWAIGLISAGIWAGRTDRRWLLNLSAIFAGIHFYTQWFDRLGTHPLTVLLAGLVMLGMVVFLWRFNSRSHVNA